MPKKTYLRRIDQRLIVLLVLLTWGLPVGQAAQLRTKMPSKQQQPAPSPPANASQETLLDLLTQMEALQMEVRQLRDKVEVQTNELERLQSRLRDVTRDLDRRVRALERGGISGARPAAPKPEASSVPPSSVSAKEQQEYEAAFQLMKQGDYTRASRSFRAFVTKYPGSGLTANAQYWIAESNYFVRNFKLALKEFIKVTESYPDSRKVPDAMLKIGYTYYELGEWDQSRKVLAEIVDRYPNTRVAQSAKSRLATMKKEGH